jgi:hypothetical protein
VTDAACRSCHNAAIHHANQIYQGEIGKQTGCASCHEEHAGRMARPALARDKMCTACHAALETAAAFESPTGGRPAGGFARTVTSFAGNHPEFRVIAEARRDTAHIKLNHQKHLRPDLPGPDGRRVQMQCGACHQLNNDGRTMAPVKFEQHCRSCHALDFDQQIRQQAPHEEPDIVDAFVRIALQKYARSSSQPGRPPVEVEMPRTLAALRLMVEQAPRDLPQWLEQRVQSADRLLFGRKCKECHNVQDTSNPPVVSRVEIPEMWMSHSRFTHKPHMTLQCASCHKNAPNSSQTSDVLLPGRSECVQCHSPKGGAPDGCSSCHAYHVG